MEIPVTTLQAMLTNAATLGAMSAVKKLDPVKDQLKASEVRTWLGNDSKQTRMFDAMVRKGMIKGFKKGTSQNSPFYYSKVQIEAAFAAVKCKNLVDLAQTRSLLDGEDRLVQPPTGLPPAETGTRNGQLAGKAVGREQANCHQVLAETGRRKTH